VGFYPMLQPLSTDLRLARLPGPTRTFAIFVQFIYFAAHGIVFPGTMAGCVAPFPRNAGAAAERFGFVPMTRRIDGRADRYEPRWHGCGP